MNQDKLIKWLTEEIATSNKVRSAMEPWERGFRAGLESLNREIANGAFNEEVKPCEQDPIVTP